MTDNVIKSTDLNQDQNKKEAVKKAPAKKAPAKKVSANADSAPKKKIEKVTVQDTTRKVIIFESGAAYVSGDYSFTRENYIQEVPEDVANHLLGLENFRLPNQLELEEFLNNKEA